MSKSHFGFKFLHLKIFLAHVLDTTWYRRAIVRIIKSAKRIVAFYIRWIFNIFATHSRIKKLKFDLKKFYLFMRRTSKWHKLQRWKYSLAIVIALCRQFNHSSIINLTLKRCTVEYCRVIKLSHYLKKKKPPQAIVDEGKRTYYVLHLVNIETELLSSSSSQGHIWRSITLRQAKGALFLNQFRSPPVGGVLGPYFRRVRREREQSVWKDGDSFAVRLRL